MVGCAGSPGRGGGQFFWVRGLRTWGLKGHYEKDVLSFCFSSFCFCLNVFCRGVSDAFHVSSLCVLVIWRFHRQISRMRFTHSRYAAISWRHQSDAFHASSSYAGSSTDVSMTPFSRSTMPTQSPGRPSSVIDQTHFSEFTT